MVGNLDFTRLHVKHALLKSVAQFFLTMLTFFRADKVFELELVVWSAQLA